MQVEIFQKKTEIPSFGECIYCGAVATETELTDEHVIPFSLGGKLVIVEGSCRECAKETSKIENELGRLIYWDFRIHTNAKTRRKKKRPTELPFLVSIDKGPPQTIYAPIKDHPFFTYLPVWGKPGLLSGDKPTDIFPDAQAHVYYWIPPNITETVNAADKPFEVLPPSLNINSERFARGIAKIAYCQAIVTFGLHGFRRLILPDLILGKYPCIPFFVGGENVDPPQRATQNIQHAIWIDLVNIGAMRLLVAHLRLFSNSGTERYGSPVYQVVVGAPLSCHETTKFPFRKRPPDHHSIIAGGAQ